MRGRQPKRSSLPQTATLWNSLGGGQFQKTYLRHIALEFGRGEHITKNGREARDDMLVMIFRASIALGELRETREYLPPDEFMRLPKDERIRFFTLNPSRDYICQGLISGGLGDGSRKNFAINAVRPVFAGTNEIHHWEVSAV